MTHTLRPYQQEAIDSVASEFRGGVKSTLITMPTGSGKTVVFSALLKRFADMNQRPSLVLAHRSELITQAGKALKRVGLLTSTEKAEQRGLDRQHDTVVASVQSLTAERLLQYPKDYFGMLVVDECHHSTSETYRAIFDHFDTAYNLGVTATPNRHDKIGLKNIYQTCAFQYTMQDAIKDGWLCKVRGQQVEVSGIHLESLKIVAGEFSQKEIDVMLRDEQTLQAMVLPTLEYAGSRPTIIFTTGVEHAHEIADCFNRVRKNCAVSIDGKMSEDDRREALQKYESGKAQFIVNVGVLCLDDQTEILTDSGWVGIDGMTEQHNVAQFHLDTDKIDFQPPLEVVRRDRMKDERMVTMSDSSYLDMRVTEGHWMIHKSAPHVDWNKSQARQLVNRHIIVPTAGWGEPMEMQTPLESRNLKSTNRRRLTVNSFALRKSGMDAATAVAEAQSRMDARDALTHKHPAELTLEECAFIGFWLGDGSRTKLQSGGIEYVLSQALVYPHIITYVDDLLASLNVDVVRRSVDNDCPHIRWSLSRGTGFGPQKRRGLFALEPYLDKKGSTLLQGLNAPQFRALLEGFWYADGDHGQAENGMPETIRIAGAQIPLYDLLQQIAVTRGISTTIRLQPKPANPKWSQQAKITFRFGRATHNSAKGHGMAFENSPWKPERVWCVKTKTRNIITRRNGKVLIMGNTEGYDHPPTACIAIFRPTKSLGLLAQMIGRGTRITDDPDKDCLVLDFVGVGNTTRTTTLMDVLDGTLLTDAEHKKAQELQAEGYDAMDALSEAKQWAAGLNAIKAKMTALSTAKAFDVLQMFAVPNSKGLYGGDRITARQLEYLTNKGLKNAETLEKGEAGKLIDRFVKRQEQGLATFKQMKYLKKLGCADSTIDTVTFHEASDLINQRATYRAY